MKHQHHFRQEQNYTIMTDEFAFELPYKFFGKIFNAIFLTAYIKQLLQKRNLVIKEFAEREKWKTVLPPQ